MSSIRLKNADPFDLVDAEPGPAVEEAIVPARMDGGYYPL
jgi:hypothetical protein